MTAPAEHGGFDALAAGWALDALEPDDLAAFERHRWGGCARCDEQASLMLALAAELAYAVPRVDPPAGLRARVLAAASPRAAASHPAAASTPAAASSPAEPVLRPVRSGRSGRHRAADRSRWTSGLVAAGLALLVGVGGWQVSTRLHGSTPPVGAAADRVAVLAPVKGGNAVATVLLGTGQATVVTSALPPSAAGRSYVLWGLPRGGGPAQALGAFTDTGVHSYRVALRQPADGYESLALSDERAGPLPAAPSKPLALGALTR